MDTETGRTCTRFWGIGKTKIRERRESFKGNRVEFENGKMFSKALLLSSGFFDTSKTICEALLLSLPAVGWT